MKKELKMSSVDLKILHQCIQHAINNMDALKIWATHADDKRVWRKAGMHKSKYQSLQEAIELELRLRRMKL